MVQEVKRGMRHLVNGLMFVEWETVFCQISVGEDRKRGSWKMAEDVKLYPGKDGLVRVIDVRFMDGMITSRPVTKLILLMKKLERSDIS
ncbi:hypothetical protein HOLleu_17484 [Holothuria leucospilota]|uniref:DUF5641 domain-containing protein n=1 Tax=Holothuria leucospilota TaxID=206669 RepID=A0A9Q1H8T5_HOLLE|nr:hypothetical protein HOLleu_17484 [Holothuria leucospilota]